MRFPDDKQEGSHRTSAPAETPTVAFATDGCVMASWGNLILVAWGIQSSLSLVDELRRLITRVAGEHTKISLVHVCIGALPLPTKEVRGAFASMTHEFADKLSCVGVSIGEEGFWASAVRSVVTHLQSISQRGPKAQLCGSVEEVSTYMARAHVTEAGVLVDARALHQALESLLAHPQLRGFGGTSA